MQKYITKYRSQIKILYTVWLSNYRIKELIAILKNLCH